MHVSRRAMRSTNSTARCIRVARSRYVGIRGQSVRVPPRTEEGYNLCCTVHTTVLHFVRPYTLDDIITNGRLVRFKYLRHIECERKRKENARDLRSSLNANDRNRPVYRLLRGLLRTIRVHYTVFLTRITTGPPPK